MINKLNNLAKPIYINFQHLKYSNRFTVIMSRDLGIHVFKSICGLLNQGYYSQTFSHRSFPPWTFALRAFLLILIVDNKIRN